MSNTANEVKINFPENLRAGTYSNNTVVGHTREEFILDFLMVTPPVGTLVSRIIVSPGHMKRLSRTILENIEKYEAKFGTIQENNVPRDRINIQ
ncbi:MAG TPA: DUF3467 domain-containing protein [Thermodesulfobacteriaceae bacterium]|nr:DUF3467 domain-containing protein [Thermodesulfobacteriaceae bacterium]